MYKPTVQTCPECAGIGQQWCNKKGPCEREEARYFWRIGDRRPCPDDCEYIVWCFICFGTGQVIGVPDMTAEEAGVMEGKMIEEGIDCRAVKGACAIWPEAVLYFACEALEAQEKQIDAPTGGEEG